MLSHDNALEHCWPPKYTLRVSARSKRISVMISAKNGLVVVVPKRKRAIPLTTLEGVLNDNRTWVEKHLKDWYKEQAKKQEEPLLPKLLYFPAFLKEIYIEYQKTDTSHIKLIRHDIAENNDRQRELILFKGCIDNIDKIISMLRKFMKSEAEHFLVPWLQQFSILTGLSYSQAIIRSQSSLWGSCTASKKISLNAKLLFLPKQLIEYVLLHELCHIKELNHSKYFWALLKKYDPQCLVHRKALRSVSQYLPRFCEYK